MTLTACSPNLKEDRHISNSYDFNNTQLLKKIIKLIPLKTEGNNFNYKFKKSLKQSIAFYSVFNKNKH